MAISPIGNFAKAFPSVPTEHKSFKDVLSAKQQINTKQESSFRAFEQPMNEALTALKTHDSLAPVTSSSKLSSLHNPTRLLEFQYKTGFALLRIQMINRTTEVAAQTVKNFLQTQI